MLKLLSKASVVKLTIAAVAATALTMWIMIRVSAAADHFGPTPQGYGVLATPTATQGNGPIEVVDFFFYDCPHCFEFDPGLQMWIGQLGDRIHVRRVPVGSSDVLKRHAALYYTLDKMGQAELFRSSIFIQLHEHPGSLDSDDQIVAWLKEQGVDTSRFASVYHSPEIASAVAAGQAEMVRDGISTVPSVVIAGKWVVSPNTASGIQPAYKVMADRILAAKSTATDAQTGS